MADRDHMDTTIACTDEACERTFVSPTARQIHLEAVHGPEAAREFKTAERKKAAKKGQATPSGGFPIKSEQDLRNAIRAFGRAGNKAQAKAHIIKRARALGLTKLLPSGWTSGDSASGVLFQIDCPECPRHFMHADTFIEHAEATHTFDDISRLVGEAVREKYYVRGDYKANPIVPSVYAWVQDLASDWVVFSVEKDGDTTLYKSSYSVTDGAVTLGEPVEVKRRTVYETVEKEDN